MKALKYCTSSDYAYGEVIEINSLEDLLDLCKKEAHELILKVGEKQCSINMLPYGITKKDKELFLGQDFDFEIEVYDDYRE